MMFCCCCCFWLIHSSFHSLSKSVLTILIDKPSPSVQKISMEWISPSIVLHYQMQPSQENIVSWLLRGGTCVFHICIPPKSLEPTAAERLTGSLCARCHPGAVRPEMDEGCSQTQAAFAYHTLCSSVPLASLCHSLPLAWTGTELSVGRHTHSPLGPDQPAAGRLWGCSFLWSFLCTHQQFIWIPRIALFCRTICELAGPAHISLLLFRKTEKKKTQETI